MSLSYPGSNRSPSIILSKPKRPSIDLIPLNFASFVIKVNVFLSQVKLSLNIRQPDKKFPSINACPNIQTIFFLLSQLYELQISSFEYIFLFVWAKSLLPK